MSVLNEFHASLLRGVKVIRPLTVHCGNSSLLLAVKLAPRCSRVATFPVDFYWCRRLKPPQDGY